MNRLTEEFHELLRPEAALIAYCCEKPQRKYYLETRPILENGKMGNWEPSPAKSPKCISYSSGFNSLI